MIRLPDLMIRLFIKPLGIFENLSAAIEFWSLPHDLSCATIT